MTQPSERLHNRDNALSWIDDMRPLGWTELDALSFAAADSSEHPVEDPFDRITFIKMFLEGDWTGIQKDFPEFAAWKIRRRNV
jgi:PIN domain nuclease of toxin-antitoxin system